MPNRPSRSTPVCPGGILYTIQPGDNLEEIATRFRVTVSDIHLNNPGNDLSHLTVDAKICIPVAERTEFPSCTILKLVAIAAAGDIQFSALTGGSVTIRQIAVSANLYALSFLATGLPEPEQFGDFNTYFGAISIRRGQGLADTAFSAVLEPTHNLNQPVTWAGTAVSRITPKNQDLLTIQPYHLGRNQGGLILLQNSSGK